MTKARVNSQHEYVSLIVEFPTGRVTLTTSFSGVKASAKPGVVERPIFSRMFKAYDVAMNKDGHSVVGTVGERSERLRAMAEASANAEMFTALLEAAVKPSATPKTAAQLEADKINAEVGVAPRPVVKKPSASRRAISALVKDVGKSMAKLNAEGKSATRPITVLKDHKPEKGEGSGKFIQRLWMAGHNDPDALVALVLRHYPNRTTKRSDVAFNVSQLRKQHGADKVPAWPKKG